MTGRSIQPPAGLTSHFLCGEGKDHAVGANIVLICKHQQIGTKCICRYTLSASCSHRKYLLVVTPFQQVIDPELDPGPHRAPGLPCLLHRLVMGKHAIKDCAILKHEHASTMLLLQLPLPFVLGTCGVVQGAIAMPLPIFELSLIPVVTIMCSTGTAEGLAFEVHCKGLYIQAFENQVPAGCTQLSSPPVSLREAHAILNHPSGPNLKGLLLWQDSAMALLKLPARVQDQQHLPAGASDEHTQHRHPDNLVAAYLQL